MSKTTDPANPHFSHGQADIYTHAAYDERRCQWQNFAAENAAFIKPVIVGGVRVQAVHDASGVPLSLSPTRDLAFASARQNDLLPLSVH